MISTVNRAFIFHNFGTAFGKNQNQIPIGRWLTDLKTEQNMKL